MGMMAAPLQDAPISAGDILIWARVEQALAGKNAALAAQINARACGRSMSPTADVEIASELARMEGGNWSGCGWAPTIPNIRPAGKCWRSIAWR